MLIQAIGAIVAALLLEGDGGGGDGGNDEEHAIARLSKLFDERIDAAFDRWLEKKDKPTDPTPTPTPTPAGDTPPTPPAGDPPKPADEPKRSPLLDLVFGAPAHRGGS